jgi:hypothetical protein
VGEDIIMTPPAEGSEDTADSGNVDDVMGAAKHEPATIIRAPLAERARPATEAGFVAVPSASLYADRLREIWEATHSGFGPPAADAGWDLIRDAVTSVENLALIGAAVASLRRERIAGMTEDSGLEGDPRTVMLLVSTALEQLPPEQYPAFMSGTLVPTLARLEREGFNREQIIDIVGAP